MDWIIKHYVIFISQCNRKHYISLTDIINTKSQWCVYLLFENWSKFINQWIYSSCFFKNVINFIFFRKNSIISTKINLIHRYKITIVVEWRNNYFNTCYICWCVCIWGCIKFFSWNNCVSYSTNGNVICILAVYCCRLRVANSGFGIAVIYNICITKKIVV